MNEEDWNDYRQDGAYIATNWDHDTAEGHIQDAHYGICLWTGRIDAHTERRLTGMLDSPYFREEKNQQKTIKLVRSMCKILAKTLSAAWTQRCKLWKDLKQMVTDTTTTVGKEETTTKIRRRKRGRDGAGKHSFRETRLQTQTQLFNFITAYPPTRELSAEQIEEDARRHRRELHASENEQKDKTARREANERNKAKRAAGKPTRKKGKNKKKPEAGVKSITEHFTKQGTTEAPNTTTTTKTATTATAAAPTSTTKTKDLRDFFKADMYIDKNLKGSSSSSSNNGNNIVCALPPGEKAKVTLVDKEIRLGIG